MASHSRVDVVQSLCGGSCCILLTALLLLFARDCKACGKQVSCTFVFLEYSRKDIQEKNKVYPHFSA